jgi:FkbM family methyltransferase
MTLKQKVLNLIFPLGSVQRIRRGYLKGFRIRLSKNSLWSPIAGRWEPDSQKLFVRVIKPGNVVYDLGANNGLHSLLFANLVGNSGKVISFEPLKSNCNEIAENLQLNNIKNVDITSAAVGDSNGEVTFHLGMHDKQGSVVGIGLQTGQEVKVKMITLDSFIAAGNPAPHFIKIDIEGAESQALQGFSGKINEVRPLLYIELHTPEQDAKVGAFLLKHNYVAYRMTNNAAANDLGIQGLEKIQDLTKPHPHPQGIWGTILCVHQDKIASLRQ